MVWELSVLIKKAPIWCPISKKVQLPQIWPLLAELWTQHFFHVPMEANADTHDIPSGFHVGFWSSFPAARTAEPRLKNTALDICLYN